MTPEEAELLIRSSPAFWFATCGHIRNKDRLDERPVPNVLQMRMSAAHEWQRRNGLPSRQIDLKIRQVGGTTKGAAILYHDCRSHPVRAVAIADVLDHSNNLFEMICYYAENDEFDWGSTFERTEKELKFSNGSVVEKKTAEKPSSTRSSTLQGLLASEVAWWPSTRAKSASETLLSLGNSLASRANTVGIKESTPAGAYGAFAEDWKAARWPEYDDYWKLYGVENEPGPGNGYLRVFAAWWEFSENELDLGAAELVALKEEEMSDEQRADEERDRAFIRALMAKRGVSDDEEIERVIWRKLAWRRWCVRGADRCRGDLEKFKQEYPSDPVSCISGGALIGTSNGILRMRDVVVGVMSDHGRVCAWQSMGIKPVFDVTTSLGYRVRATGDHLLAKSAGGFVPVEKSLGVSICLQPPVFASQPFVTTWIDFGIVESSLVITKEWARFLGYFMGDGSIYNNSLSIVCDIKDQDVVDDVCWVVECLFGKPQVKKVRSGAMEVRLSRVRFHPLFQRLGIISEITGVHDDRLHKRQVCVPECIWRSPKEIIREFLKALFEADGWISQTGRNVKFFSKSEEFCRDIQLLLLGFGVHCTLNKVVKHLNGKFYEGCELLIYVYAAKQFCEEIGFIGSRKQSRFTDAPPKKKGGRRAVVHQLDDVVASITEAGTEEVFDIQIAGEPVFGASGILVHNCWLHSGRPRFNNEGLTRLERMAKGRRPEYGVLDQQADGTVTFQRTSPNEALVQVWEEPRAGCYYGLPIDPMTGKDQTTGALDPDHNSVGVIRRGYRDEGGVEWNPMLVARIIAPNVMDASPLMEVTSRLARWYGNCLVIPEANKGLHVIERCKDHRLNIYRRSVGIDKLREQLVDRVGWETNENTRLQIIEDLADLIRRQAIDIYDPGAIAQLRTFVRNKQGRPEAAPHCHDDDAIMLAIGVHCMDSFTKFSEPKRRSIKRDRHDYW